MAVDFDVKIGGVRKKGEKEDSEGGRDDGGLE